MDERTGDLTISIELTRSTTYVWEGTAARAAELTGTPFTVVLACVYDGGDWDPEESGLVKLIDDAADVHNDDITMETVDII